MTTQSSPEPRKSHPLRSFASRTGWVAWSTIIAAVVGFVVFQGRDLLFDDPPSLREQLASIRASIARDNRYPAVQLTFDTHGSGSKSLFMLVRDNRIAGQTGEAVRSPRSDELRMYDVVDRRYVLRFRFRPENPRDGGLYYWFRFDGSIDLNGDGADEVVGSYSRYFMGPEFPTPIVLAWNARDDQYDVSALIQTADHLDNFKPAGLFGQAANDYYRKLTLLANEDVANATDVSGYAVQEYALAENRDRGYVLLAALIANAPSHADPYELRLAPMRVLFEGARFEASLCFLGDQRFEPNHFDAAGSDLTPELLKSQWKESGIQC